MEKVIDNMLGLLSVQHHASQGRLTPMHFIAVVDPHARWFIKWMVRHLLLLSFFLSFFFERGQRKSYASGFSFGDEQNISLECDMSHL